MAKKSNKKEIYRLWWEYLKRSEDYKEFCEWFREKRKNPDIPIPDKFKSSKKGPAEADDKRLCRKY